MAYYRCAAFLLFCGLLTTHLWGQLGLFEQQRNQYREGVKQYPLLNKRQVQTLFQLRVVDQGELGLFTPLEAGDYQQRRADLEGFSETAVVLCWQISRDFEQVQFEFGVDDYTDPRVCGRLHLQARHMGTDGGKDRALKGIDIEKIWQTKDGFRRVSFSQANGTVRMQIFANDTGGLPLNENFVEPDFLTLRRNHHAEAELWLRPILRELHQEAAFAADPAAAWQVLSADWPVNPSLIPPVTARLKDLDDADYHVRRRAAQALEKMGRDAAVLMLKMDRRALSAEQNLRLDNVIAHFTPLTDLQAAHLRDDPNFLLDCLYGDDATARKLAVQRLSTLTKKPIDWDATLTDEERIAAVNVLRAKLFPTPRDEKNRTANQ